MVAFARFKENLSWKLCHREIKETTQNLTNQVSLRQEAMDLQQPCNAPNASTHSCEKEQFYSRGLFVWFLLCWNTIFSYLYPHPEQCLSFCLLKNCFFMCENFFQLETMFHWMRRWWERKLFKNWKKLCVKFLFTNYNLISTDFPFLTFLAAYWHIWRISLLHDFAEQLRNLSCVAGFYWATVVARNARETGVGYLGTNGTILCSAYTANYQKVGATPHSPWWTNKTWTRQPATPTQTNHK